MSHGHGTLTIHIDGAARGNPGPAAYGFIIRRDGQPPLEESACLGSTTNNLAEYTALVRALERSETLGAKRLHIRSDSELLVKQMNGIYRVKNEQLKQLYEQAKELIDHFDDVQIEHVRREQNRDADRLCNEALDGRPGTKVNHQPEPTEANSAVRMAREAALPHLAEALRASARGDKSAPAPEVLWDQLWRVLQQHGVVTLEEE